MESLGSWARWMHQVPSSVLPQSSLISSLAPASLTLAHLCPVSLASHLRPPSMAMFHLNTSCLSLLSLCQRYTPIQYNASTNPTAIKSKCSMPKTPIPKPPSSQQEMQLLESVPTHLLLSS